VPELPEVETVLRGLQRLAIGRRITTLSILNAWVIVGSPDKFRQQVQNRSICALKRKGKALAVRLSTNGEEQPVYLLVRLGMTGQFVLASRDAPVLPHTHVRMGLDHGDDELRYRDSRRFGRLRCCSEEELTKVLGSMGPDALEVSEAEFRDGLRCRRGAVKALLLNQGIIAGLGNIYADEALFGARIHPETPAGRITPPRARALLQSIRSVLHRAVELQGTSFRDYIDIEGRPGNFAQRLHVYGRGGEPCLNCGTPIRRITISGRSSHFCPRCQRRPRSLASRLGRRKPGAGKRHSTSAKSRFSSVSVPIRAHH
jgi:formamidopyrimidine-DNA glycosylase